MIESKNQNDKLNYSMELAEELNNIKNNRNYFALEKCIEKYDEENLLLIEGYDIDNYIKIKNEIKQGFRITSKEKQDLYSKELLSLINSIKKSDIKIELPILCYNKSLTDIEFIDLLKKCINYANYNLESSKLNSIKKQLIDIYNSNLKDLFKKEQVLKDLL